MPTTLNKPAGMTVFPPHADPDGDCLLRQLLAREAWRMEIHWPEGFEGGIAHRLDTSTSGAVVAADSLDELAVLRQWFSSHQLVKTYRFLAAREVAWNENACERAIAHDQRKRGRMVVERGGHTPHRGKWYPARTEFSRVSGRVWEATISTGVMHQIRVHAAFLGIPVLGDRRYGGTKTDADTSSISALPASAEFYLHHVGMTGPEGFRTDPVPLPAWATK